MWEDYTQVFIDFGVNSNSKIKSRVLFVIGLANQDLIIGANAENSRHPDSYGYFLFDFSC